MKWKYLFLALVGLAGCGTGTGSSSNRSVAPPPIPQACAAAVTGTIHDSLTGAPVAQGVAVLETGTRLGTTANVDFQEAARAAADASGTFRLCLPAVVLAPAVVVLLGTDAFGGVYPPYVAEASGSAQSLGTVPLGGCSLACGDFPGQQQAGPGVVVTGTITTTPAAEAGTVAAQAAVAAPDGSRDLWEIAVPGLGAGENGAFQTAAAPGCAGPCATYHFTLPTRQPFVQGSSGTHELAAPASYVVYATTKTSGACRTPFASTIFQSDMHSPLTAAPGATLTAAPLTFTGCS